MLDRPLNGPTTAADKSNRGIQVISRAASILRAIREAPGGLTPTELATQLGLARTTVHRIMAALEKEGFIAPRRDMHGGYRIGPEITRLADAGQRDLVGLMRPLLSNLSAQLTETVDLAILDNGQVTFIDQVEAPHRLRAASAVGESFPLHSCAPGKALLATMSPSRFALMLPTRLPAFTERTITSLDDLTKEIERVREVGVAFDYEEQNDGICAAGVAISLAGQMCAVSIPIPARRFTGREQECQEALLALRDQVEQLGWD